MSQAFTGFKTHLLIACVVIGTLGLTACTTVATPPSAPDTPAAETRSAAPPPSPAVSAVAPPVQPETLSIVSYRSPTCGCCGSWVEHMRSRGFDVEDHVTEDMDAIKAKYGVPDDLVSCHTAIADGYVIEGHTPAEDVRRLLTERPDITGIATPGMPLGSPGMESGDIREPYTVYGFSENAEPMVFAEHQQES